MNPTTMNRVPTIAIVTSNSLMGVGLRSLLNEMIPIAAIELIDIEQLGRDAKEHFHIFVSANIALENIALFEPCRAKTILLTNGTPLASVLSDYKQIDVSGSSESIKGQLSSLHTTAHHPHHAHAHEHKTDILTPREIEVLHLLVDGMLNKEIADQLNISLTTVISHRKNIVEKLGIRSLSGLTIYAVMKGYVEI